MEFERSDSKDETQSESSIASLTDECESSMTSEVSLDSKSNSNFSLSASALSDLSIEVEKVPSTSHATANNQDQKRSELDILGIRRINISTVCTEKKLTLNSETHDLQQLYKIVEEVISLKEGDKRKEPFVPFPLKNEKLSHNDGDNQVNYFIRIYRQKITSQDLNLEHFLEKSEKDSTNEDLLCRKACYNNIFFFCRPATKESNGEIYALPTNTAWKSIQWCVDYEFPTVIARRLLTTQGQLTKKSNYIMDNRRSASVVNKQHAISSRLFEIEDMKTITSSAREDSSLFNLPIDAFKTAALRKEPIKDLKIEKGAGFIKFNKPLTKNEFIILFSHFSRISHGCPTYTYGHENEPGFEEMDCYVHDSPFKRVESKSLKVALNNLFLKQLHEMIEQEQVGNFEFSHNHAEDLARGDQYCLQYSTLKDTHTIIEKFDQLPLLSEIFTAVKISKPFKTAVKKKNKPNWLNILSRTLTKFSFTFKVVTMQKESERLLSCIQGDMRFKEEVYWRKQGTWYFILNDQVVSIHTEFIDLLKKRLIEEGSKANLNHKWLNKSQKEKVKNEINNLRLELGIDQNKTKIAWENIYNMTYATRDNFLVGDCNLTKGHVELFDILQIVKEDDGSNHAFLYHVKKQLGNNTRAAIAQIQCAANLLKGALSGKNTGEIETVYNKSRAAYPNFMEKYNIKKYVDFLQLLRHSTFVYAFIDVDDKDGPMNRKMAEEKEIQVILSKENIKQCFKDNSLALGIENRDIKSKSKEYSEAMHTYLKDNTFIDEMNLIIHKFLYATKNIQNRSGAPEERQWDLILKTFRSAYSSIGTKLELLRVDLQGFNFKICEIIVDSDKEQITERFKNVIDQHKDDIRKKKTEQDAKNERKIKHHKQ